MSSFTDKKDPQSVRAESIDWTAELALSSPADTISTSEWTASDGLVVDSNSKTNQIASCVVSAGRLGAYCNLTNSIVTAAGYKYDSTITVEIVQT